jgi:hypothetical protein
MVKRAFEEEFAATGVKGVREKVQQGVYEPEKHEQALKWLNRRDPTRKAWRAAKNTLQLARVTSRRMRITLGLSAISVGLLVLAVYMLWRIMELLHNH